MSPLSSAMFAKWFEILNDNGIVWGENAIVEEGEHASIDSATSTQLVGRGRAASLPATVKSPDATEVEDEQRILFNCTWSAIQGNEVAVKYTGNAPRLQVIGSNWKGGWWGVSADTVDRKAKIAYFKDTTIRDYWQSQLDTNGDVAGLALDDIAFIGLRTADSGSKTAEDAKLQTQIEEIALVHRHEWGAWTRNPSASGASDVAESRVCIRDSSHTLTRLVGDFTSWSTVVAATCTAGGSETRAYKKYPSYRQERSTAALGHSWDAGAITTEPSATANGIRTFTCTRCGETRTEVVPATGIVDDGGQESQEREPRPAEARRSRSCFA